MRAAIGGIEGAGAGVGGVVTDCGTRGRIIGTVMRSDVTRSVFDGLDEVRASERSVIWCASASAWWLGVTFAPGCVAS